MNFSITWKCSETNVIAKLLKIANFKIPEKGTLFFRIYKLI